MDSAGSLLADSFAGHSSDLDLDFHLVVVVVAAAEVERLNLLPRRWRWGLLSPLSVILEILSEKLKSSQVVVSRRLEW